MSNEKSGKKFHEVWPELLEAISERANRCPNEQDLVLLAQAFKNVCEGVTRLGDIRCEHPDTWVHPDFKVTVQ